MNAKTIQARFARSKSLLIGISMLVAAANAGAAGDPLLELSTDSLAGESVADKVVPFEFTVSNIGSGMLTYDHSNTEGWITVGPPSNGDFERGTAKGGGTADVVDDWVFIDILTSGDHNDQGYYETGSWTAEPAADNAWWNIGRSGQISQITPINMVSGTTYRVRLSMRQVSSSYAKVQVAFTDSSATDLVFGAGHGYSASHGSANGATFNMNNSAGELYEASFTADAAEDGQTLGLRIASVRDVSTALLGVDDVRVSAALAGGQSFPHQAVINTEGLTNGMYNGSIVFSETSGAATQQQTIAVSLLVRDYTNPPAFLMDPTVASPATVYTTYSDSIAGTATDSGGGPLIYSKIAGPAWLNVATNGVLSGVPTGTDIGLNYFTVQAEDADAEAGTATFEIMVDGNGTIAVFSDDFNTGFATLGSYNGWTGTGPENKKYNVGSSGMLVIEDLDGNEKGTGAHDGYFDSVEHTFRGAALINAGDRMTVSMDISVVTGSWGSAILTNSPGGLRIGLTDSMQNALGVDSGYGLFLATGTSTSHSLREFETATTSQGSSLGDLLTGYDAPEDGALQRVIFTLERVAGGGIKVSGSYGGNPFTPITATSALINDNTFDTLSISVGSFDMGLKIDNVVVTIPDSASLWNQYVDARAGGTEPILPDFSYAGYHFGEDPIPTVDCAVFDVTDYGAVADDGLSDKEAIKAAIAAAEANGTGIIFFPPGRFDINVPTTPWTNDLIVVEGSHIVFRGSGRGPGGTELFSERHTDPSNPSEYWTCPMIIQFNGPGLQQSTASDVVADSARETFSVTVANASIFRVDDWVQLHRLDNSTQAVAEAVAPYAVDPLWTDIISNGVRVGEYHLIDSIAGNEITFNAPIHSDVTSTGNWSVILFEPLEEVGVEDIAFTGNWTNNFVHHASYYADSGWSGLEFDNVVNSWVRNCRFTDWSYCSRNYDIAAVSFMDIKIDGNGGHGTLQLKEATHCFVGMHDDTSGNFHACGVSGHSAGNVFWKSSYTDDTCHESHGEQPRCTLYDNVSGGWEYGRLGGSSGNQPNHLNYLIYWNYKNTGPGVAGLYEFMRSSSIYGRIIMPYLIGFHGNEQAFDVSQLAAIDSHGFPVEPQSLYEAQYELRKGKPFTELLYDTWTTSYGLSGPSALYTGDPDDDSRENLTEYAIGGIPVAGTNSPTEFPDYGVVGGGGAEEMQYVYVRRRNADALGLTYAVEFTDDLTAGTWSAATVSEIGSGVIDDDFESVTNRVLISGAINGFLRLNIGADFNMTQYEEWADDYGLSGTDAAYSADPDEDGLNNMYEWGLGGNPANGDDRGIAPAYGTVYSGGTNWFTYTFPSNTAADNLIYTIQFDEDLVNAPGWSNVSAVVDMGMYGGNPSFYAVTNYLPIDGTTNGFIRLRIDINE